MVGSSFFSTSVFRPILYYLSSIMNNRGNESEESSHGITRHSPQYYIKRREQIEAEGRSQFPDAENTQKAKATLRKQLQRCVTRYV